MTWLRVYMAFLASIGAGQIYDGMLLMHNKATYHSFLFFLLQSFWVFLTPSMDVYYIYRYIRPIAPLAFTQFVLVGWAVLACSDLNHVGQAAWNARAGLAEALFGIFFLGINLFDLWKTFKPASSPAVQSA